MSDVEVVMDPRRFRDVLGQYPTGVCVVTAMLEGKPAGIVVGSFTSVSLNPPLVAFLPDRNSSTWSELSRASQFCINILAADHESLCRTLAARNPDKFAGLDIRLSPNGSPILGGVVAWIDCDLHSAIEAGDHYFVLCAVKQLEIAAGGLPLLFFQGGYGRFAPSSLVMSDTHDVLTEQLRIVDLARSEMERIAADAACQCIATILLGDVIVVAASAGQAVGENLGIPVGERLPFAPPLGSTFAAWLGQGEIDRWIGKQANASQRQAYSDALATLRQRGFSIAVQKGGKLVEIASKFQEPRAPARNGRDLEDFVRSFEADPSGMAAEPGPEVRMISAPIFDAEARVAMTLTLQGFVVPVSEGDLRQRLSRLLEGTRRITQLLGGLAP